MDIVSFLLGIFTGIFFIILLSFVSYHKEKKMRDKLLVETIKAFNEQATEVEEKKEDNKTKKVSKTKKGE